MAAAMGKSHLRAIEDSSSVGYFASRKTRPSTTETSRAGTPGEMTNASFTCICKRVRSSGGVELPAEHTWKWYGCNSDEL